jgi:hypothetical protein
MGESVTLGMFFSISPQREMHVSDACVGAVGAICCQCGGASVEFVHSGMSSMIPPKPRGSGCLVLLVHHLVALRPKHSNLRALVGGSLKNRQFYWKYNAAETSCARCTSTGRSSETRG